ncbi:unnamed protein product [Medioppia subpectinata]|uniref:Elongation of very long chain fatty acids protein n=1 Tax=Medioppia subpectinata TaxID=1979941 RepID=A0A7R9KWB5_9ACAR|nr:unnamed protein product [Medioppia subpectinata]CAG2111035.1 unnamed protein product [Medioppia subpectinata]
MSNLTTGLGSQYELLNGFNQIIISKMANTSLRYSYVFEFERNFNYNYTTKWMSENWMTSFYFITTYLIIIFGGQQWMKDREPFKLRSTLFLWNLLLAMFSISGTVRVMPEILSVIREQGFFDSVCDNGYITRVNVSSLWTWLFKKRAPNMRVKT